MNKLSRFLSVVFLCSLAFTLLGLRRAGAQKYIFAHYDIEDGLIQSQVNKLSQDVDHRLWIATFGGVCRFDGKEFTGYNRRAGLPDNYVSTIFSDKNGGTWFGTLSGLARLYNGQIVKYNPDIALHRYLIGNITQDGEGTIWVTSDGMLFKVKNGKMQHVTVDDNNELIVTSIAVNADGKLHVAVYKNGIYKLTGKMWRHVVDVNPEYANQPVKRIFFDRFSPQKTYLLTLTNLLCVKDGTAQPLHAGVFPPGVKGQLLCIEQDAEANIWLGTDNGAYCICNDGGTLHYNSANGLTDNAIADIFLDADKNLWLGSLGNGLYRCEGDRYTVFDRSQGIPESKIVMSLATDWNNNVLMGIEGSGILRYDGKKLSNILVPEGIDAYLKNIQSLYTDKSGTVWIGTVQAGLWQYDKSGFKQVKDSWKNYAYNFITSSDDGTVWLATSQGCFYYNNGVLKQLNGIPSYSSSIVTLGRDSVFIATQGGVMLAVNKSIVSNFKLKSFPATGVYCMIIYKTMLLVGTDDSGLYTCDMKTGATRIYTVKDGLKANSIYSMVADERGRLWLGTGRGINRMKYDPVTKTFGVIDNVGFKEPVVEANQNAILHRGHEVWISTTKSVMVYSTKTKMEPAPPPHVMIKSVQLLKEDGEKRSSIDLDDWVRLKHNQNHLSITFLGVYLKNPDAVSYQYKLVGLDSAFSAPMHNNVVNYPSLPPGSYTFKVKAIGPDGQQSTNMADFHFEIIPPFYQTFTFRLVAVMLLVLLGFGVQNLVHQRKVKRQKAIEAMKREEKLKIRQQTAEDFHDDLGNKLTRITVLSEILSAKIDQEKSDQRGIVDQIRQNAASLYNGTKDILWALDPKSDNLHETLAHIREIGVELFHDVPVDFEFAAIDEDIRLIKLPMEYSRNITMIFKELLNNILKHANASVVTFELDQRHKHEIALIVTDDGKGFDMNAAHRGRGINNVNARAKRINARLDINSSEGKGSTTILTFGINQLNY
ncbi:two component regulator with propeller domain [Mucilaginibacter oryzae]|uniref:Two component regulator with propeller domain n=1 Tax=Mucilaginibacter oryzae TaxID=468058 RepID=A0A316HFQ7_9SPHI|nr:sensor histidine kinase [Mucilaginibacter oryzae]PWK80044.1 two component regulator with propeller domain [Mucilaginibacter oryzae]